LDLKENRLAVPLELLIRVTALRRDFSTVFPNAAFWHQPLDDIEGLVPIIVATAFDDSGDKEWAIHARGFESSVATALDRLGYSLLDYAEELHLDVMETRGPAQGYPVLVVIEPPKARVRYMPYLQYKICDSFKVPLENQWSDLDAGIHTLIGRYHYLAEWPASLNGPVDGNFEVREEHQTQTFRPRSK
jgi:hypothetical protein